MPAHGRGRGRDAGAEEVAEGAGGGSGLQWCAEVEAGGADDLDGDETGAGVRRTPAYQFPVVTVLKLIVPRQGAACS